METEIRSSQTNADRSIDAPSLQPGDTVIYALHGKCVIRAIENRTVDGKQIPFYRLEVVKSTLSRSRRQEPAIWLPVDAARERGLRAPLTPEGAQNVLNILADREYYFSLNESWHAIQIKLEHIIRTEGAIGLAKALSYLFVLKRKQIVPTPEVAKMDELVTKLLYRELSEATGEAIRDIEEKATRALRHKLIPDT